MIIVEGFDVGNVFPSKEHIRKQICMAAMRKKFAFKTKKSNKRFFKLLCLDSTCKWKLRANRLGNSDSFHITIHDRVHTCSSMYTSQSDRHIDKHIIAEQILDKFEDVHRVVKPHDIINDIRNEFGIVLSYSTAWRAKEEALTSVRGSPEQSFQMLPKFCYMLQQKNPGTIIDIHTDKDNTFKYLFIAFGASRMAFHMLIRPVLAIDGTFLTAKYKGTLLIATGKDANNQTYPLAFGIVDSENTSSWKWFFLKIKETIGNIPQLVVVSDQHKAIASTISTVFPDAIHGICVNHLRENLKRKSVSAAIRALYDSAAYSYRYADFEYYFSQINASSKKATELLKKAGVNKWSRTHCTSSRYNIMTTNISESLNAVLKDARDVPIISLLEEIQKKMQIWYDERRTAAEQMKTTLSTWAEEILVDRHVKAKKYNVIRINAEEFVVTHGNINEQVNLLIKSCSCREFDLDHLPCEHAMAACVKYKISWYEMCSSYYYSDTLKMAYAQSIYPAGDMRDWIIPLEIESMVILPPKTKARSGRHKKQRTCPSTEHKKSRKCTRCSQYGHNRKTCIRPISWIIDKA